MRCREVRRKLTSFVADGSHPEGWGTQPDGPQPIGGAPELGRRGRPPSTGPGTLTEEEREAIRAHLEQCADCARLLQTERLLAADLKNGSQADTQKPLSIEQVRRSIAIRDERQSKTNPGVRIMRQISESIYSRPRLSLTVAAVSAMLLASVFIPVKTERPVGFEVAFAAPASDVVLNAEEAGKLLAALELYEARVDVNENNAGIEYSIKPVTDSAKVERLMAVLDSLGGKKIRRDSAPSGIVTRTIWQIMFDAVDKASPDGGDNELVINLKELFPDDALLWMPVNGQADYSMMGLLMEKQGEKTNIHIVGGDKMMGPDECGFHQYLNNSVMHTERPDGVEDTFRLYDIHDVRRLEELGYNFATMKWDTPGQIPIPGMGPKLNEIVRDKSGDRVTIEIMVPRAYEVSVQILAEDETMVRTLRDCIMLAGIANLVWDGRDEAGESVALGRYLCRFRAGEYVETLEFVLGR